MGYQPPIDGLRGVAIALVLAFHFGLIGAERGYLGVDLFLLISGYLVGGQVLCAMRERRFSAIDFARRRHDPPHPPLLVTGAATLLIGWWVLLPQELADAAEGVRAALLLFANHHYYALLDYFAPAKVHQYFLHSWSLSLEEQFYLLFPLAAWVLVRLRAPLPLLMGLSVIAGLLMMEWLRQRYPVGAFYLLPARAWQFLAGAWIATLTPVWLRRVGVGAVTGWLGLAVMGAVLFGGEAVSRGSDLAMLLTFSGGAVLTLASVRSTPGSGPGMLLSWRPLLWLGGLSYALYLVHWPLLTLARAWLIVAPTSLLLSGLALLSLAIGWALHRGVEVPVRMWSRSAATPSWQVFAAAAGGVGAVVLLATLMIADNRRPDALDARTAQAWAGASDSNPLRENCVRDERSGPLLAAEVCVVGRNVAPRTVIWGDSHAAEVAFALGEGLAARGESLAVLVSAACPPLAAGTAGVPGWCERHNVEAVDYLPTEPGIDTVVLMSFFDGYQGQSPEQHLAGLRARVAALRAGGRRVVLIAPLPLPAFDVPRGLARQIWLSGQVTDAALPVAAHRERTRGWWQAMAPLTEDAGVRIIDPARWLCDARRCPYASDGAPLYIDDNHLTRTGAIRLRAMATSIR
jgi:peptidoglycan/LPS O-acetylase OafA/YrhL